MESKLLKLFWVKNIFSRNHLIDSASSRYNLLKNYHEKINVKLVYSFWI
jgi:hypothetical protein